MKKLKLFVMFSLLLVSLFNLAGCGEKVKVTHISSKEDLLLLQDGGNFILDNDIDCEGLSLKAIQNFSGSIDGNGYVIKNVNFISDNHCFGLIGSIATSSSVTFKNLGIVDFTIDTLKATSTNSLYAGGLLASNLQNNDAQNFNEIIIENCYADGDINIDINVKDLYVGGLVGASNRPVTINNSYSDVDIECDLNDSSFSSFNAKVGGLMGYSWSYRSHPSYFNNNVFTGSIDVDTTLGISLKSNIKAGGIVGAMDGYHEMSYCLSTPDYILASSFFKDNVYIGGLTGHFSEWNGAITYSYYCNYDDDSLIENERHQKCSIYQGNTYAYGTGVKLYKTDMLSKDFMKGDYTFTDLDGKRKDSFLNFSEEIWNFGKFDGDNFINPSLKVFDK